MNLILKPKAINFRDKSIRVIDNDGNTEIFDSIRACANALDVTISYIYNSLRTGRAVRGCRIEVVS